MGSSESCCRKDDIGTATSKESKETIHAAAAIEVEAGPDDLECDTPEIQVEEEELEEPEEPQPQEPDLSLDPRLLRGISLKKSLRNFGRVWKTAPSELVATDHAYLSRITSDVDRFDVFLSHTWKTSGRLKYWALLLGSAWPTVILSWCILTMLTAILTAARVLPATGFYPAESYNFQNWAEIGPWMRISGILGFLLGFIAAPFACQRSEIVFVDVVSINQADPELTKRGVYGLAGFLSKSAELRVLWSPPLFSRLWCIFELAAFRKANPNGRIVLAPLYVEALFGILYVGLGCLMLTFLIIQQLGIGAIVQSIVALCPAFPVVHYIRKTLQEKRRLLAELQRFDLEQARCLNEFDRDFIHARISEWYGSREAFTEHVRGPLYEELSAPLSNMEVPVAYWVLVALLESSSLLEFQLAYYRGGAPLETLLAQFFASVLGAVLWRIVVMRVALVLCDYFSHPGSSCCINLLKTFFVWFVTVAFMSLSFQVTYVAERQGPMVALAAALIAAVCVFLALGGWSWITRRCRVGHDPS